MILCRDRAGEVHVFLNSCRHRGMKVCRYDEGNTDGLHLPLSRLELRHRRAAGRRAVFPRGLSFDSSTARNGASSRSRSCATTRARSGRPGTRRRRRSSNISAISRRYLDLQLDGWDGREGQAEVLGGVAEMAGAVQLEIPGREFQRRHLSQHQPPLGRPRRHRARRAAAGATWASAMSAASCMSASPTAATRRSIYVLPRPAAAAGLPERADRRRVFPALRGGEAASARRHGAGWSARPARSSRTRRCCRASRARWRSWHPRGPHQTECWRWFFVDKDAPAEVKAFLRDYYIRYSGPAGMTEQDDMENWNYAHAASRGTIARRYPYNYEQGHRHRRRPITNTRGCASPARSSTSPRCSRASSRRATSTAAGPSSWRPTTGTSSRPGAMRKPRVHRCGAPGPKARHYPHPSRCARHPLPQCRRGAI